MAERSAVALVELLLGDAASPPSEPLAAALRRDPSLVLWAVCAAGANDDLKPRSVDDLARWLAQHALEVLQWEIDPEALAEPPWASQGESSADRVSIAVQAADLAARLADRQEPSTAEAAFLLGLLHDAEGWLAAAGDPHAKSTAPLNCLPQWLAAADHTPAAALVRQAVGVLCGETPLSDSAGIDLETSRQRGADAARGWLAPVEGMGDWLPPLAAKLARLADLQNQFQRTLETEKLEAMAEFAAGAGHEINNPLTVIAGRAQLLMREAQDQEPRRSLALISAQAKRAYEMIADMMLFARPPEPEPSTIDLVELVDRVLEEVSPQAARQEITVRRTGQPGPVEAEADATQLTVALRAMCQNSIEAIGREGQIEIEVNGNAREVQIRIIDDGPGVSPEERRHLFDPYYSARQAGRGLGLGLSKCWRIVTNHGGRIKVESQPGHGTVFTINLPQHRL